MGQIAKHNFVSMGFSTPMSECRLQRKRKAVALGVGKGGRLCER